MEQLGYESHNSVLNLGSLFIFIVIYYFLLLINILIFRTLSILTKNQSIKDIYEKLSSKLYFGEFIALSLDAYMEFTIAGWLTINAPLMSTSGEIIALYVGGYSVIVALVILPLFSTYILWQDTSRL